MSFSKKRIQNLIKNRKRRFFGGAFERWTIYLIFVIKLMQSTGLRGHGYGILRSRCGFSVSAWINNTRSWNDKMINEWSLTNHFIFICVHREHTPAIRQQSIFYLYSVFRFCFCSILAPLSSVQFVPWHHSYSGRIIKRPVIFSIQIIKRKIHSRAQLIHSKKHHVSESVCVCVCMWEKHGDSASLTAAHSRRQIKISHCRQSNAHGIVCAIIVRVLDTASHEI